MNKKFVLIKIVLVILTQIKCFKSDQVTNLPILSVQNATFNNQISINESNLTFKINEKETISLKCPLETDKEGLNEQQSTDLLNEAYEDDQQVEDYDSLVYQDDNLKKKRDLTKKPLTIVQWFKDSVKVNKFTFSNRFELDGIYLKIKNVRLNDSGKYKCKLLNGAGALSSVINLIVQKTNDSSDLISTTKTPKPASTKKRIQIQKSPFFLNIDNMVLDFHKQKGSQVKFNCRASGVPRPDILWFKNGQILNEEDYGITRSKWTLELKDLRIDDSGNFTCQVFNKYGFINATFELDVYEDSQIFEGLDPLNSTITAGMDAVFNCKVKTSTIPNIKWMKQISKTEYTNYVVKNSNSNENLMLNDISIEKDDVNIDEFKSLYIHNSLPSLKVIEKINKKNQNYDDSELNDLLTGTDFNLNKQDDFNFELFVTNEMNSLNQKENKLETKLNDDSVHYITLSSSDSIIEKLSFNKEKNYYISQLTIKSANIKDSGIYVCFAGNSKGYSNRKSYLKVVPSQIKSTDFYQNDYSSYYKLNNLYNKPIQTTTQSTSILSTIQSIGYLIIIVPVVLILIFAFISICYLKKLDSQKDIENNDYKEKSSSILSVLKSLVKSPSNKSIQKNGKFCPASLTHALIQGNYDDKKDTFGKNTLSTNASTDHTSTLQCVTTSLGSSLSDSSSTSETTVAYYATIPLLTDNLPSSPPPLPSSQPPTFSNSFNNSIFSHNDTRNNNNNIKLVNETLDYGLKKLERTESTPSMAYYKIVDSDLMNLNEAKFRHENDEQVVSDYKQEENMNCSTRFYYQLAPNGNLNNFYK